jgi:ammonia channel protein AmtB
MGRGLSTVGVAAGFVLAAGGRAIRVVNQDVVLARRADDAVEGVAGLRAAGLVGVLAVSFFAAEDHAAAWDRRASRGHESAD